MIHQQHHRHLQPPQPPQEGGQEWMYVPLWPHSVDIVRRHRKRFRLQQRRQLLQQQLQEMDPAPAAAEAAAATDDDLDDAVVEDWMIDALYLGLGTHYVDLWVGCPKPQRQTVIIDTGSQLTAFPCLGCLDNCGAGTDHIDTLFKQNESSCFYALQCPHECVAGTCENDASDSNDDEPPRRDLLDTTTTSSSSSLCALSTYYMEGSGWEAFECVDRVYSGGYHDRVDTNAMDHASVNLTFGCQTSVSGLFKTQLADGIAGMMASPTSYWAQLYDAGVISKAQFSLCYTRPMSVSRAGTMAGAMVLGGTDMRLHQTPMVFADLIVGAEDGAYFVTLERIYLRTGGGESIMAGEGSSSSPSSSSSSSSSPHGMKSSNSSTVQWTTVKIPIDQINAGGVIVDSGTTNTFLSETFAQSFNTAWRSVTGTDYDNDAHPYAPEDMDALPTIIFQFRPWKNESILDTPGIAGVDLDPEHPHSILVTFPPSHYLRPVRGGSYMSRLVFSKPAGSSQTLGANFMLGKDVLFDIDNSRLGFAESNCDYLSLSTMHNSSGKVDDRVSQNALATSAPGPSPFITSPVSSTHPDAGGGGAAAGGAEVAAQPTSRPKQECQRGLIMCAVQKHGYGIIVLFMVTILFVFYRRRPVTRVAVPVDLDDSLPYHDDDDYDEAGHETEMVHRTTTQF